MKKPPTRDELYQAVKDLPAVYHARVKLARKKSPLSVKEMAEMMSASPHNLYVVFSRTQGNVPNAARLMQLALVLDVSVDYLLGIDDGEQ